MNEAANFGGLKPMDKLREDIYLQGAGSQGAAPDAGHPVERADTYIVISARYQQTADIFGYKYVYSFDKKVEKPIF